MVADRTLGGKAYPERIIQETIIFRSRHAAILERKIDLGDGHVVDWEVIDKGSDSVAVVPVDTSGTVTLVDEYFAATDERALGLAKGKIDPGETPLDAATREMQEEIGLRGDLDLLASVSISPGYLTQKTHIYLASNLRPSSRAGDEIQFITPVRMPLDDAIEHCRTGLISEARAVAGLFLAKLEIESKLAGEVS